MSRIRSVHPGLWTDEDFVTLSAFARLFFMGLWNECDDKGIFEWKPITLKMRLLPADNVDAAALLDEIATAGGVRRYEIDGKSYGAVRNFQKYQRPKKPNDIHPSTAEILAFCGSGSEPEAVEGGTVGNQWGIGGEIAPQMEDGGDKGREDTSLKVPANSRADGTNLRALGINPRELAKKGEYPFSGKVVRLNRQDYTAFRKQFHAIVDFDAELAALDGWLCGQPAAKQKNWFGSVAPWLNKRHQEALARSKPRAEPAFSGPC